MSDAVEINIPVLIECELTEGWGGERWSVVSVIDERQGHSLGDIGFYEFDAYSEFSETLLNAVINTLEERGEFAVTVNCYCIEVNIYNGGSKLGSSSKLR